MISINWQPSHLENDSVRLDPLQPGDFERLYTVASDPMIWEQHPDQLRHQREVFQGYFDGAISGGMAFIIIDKITDKVIGSTRYYDYNPEESSIAIGYTFLAKEYWGGKYNKYSKDLLLGYAFTYVDKVYFHIGINNTRSQIATSRIGAEKIREVDMGTSGKAPHFEYRMDKQLWQKIRKPG